MKNPVKNKFMEQTVIVVKQERDRRYDMISAGDF